MESLHARIMKPDGKPCNGLIIYLVVSPGGEPLFAFDTAERAIEEAEWLSVNIDGEFQVRQIFYEIT